LNFFRTCIYICMSLILFTLVINFIDGTGAFPADVESGQQVTTDQGSGGALSVFTNLDDANMNAVWGIAVGLTGLGAIGLAWLTHSIAPVGIHLFSTVFWTSYIRAWGVVSVGGFTDDIGGLMLVFTVGILFLFIAAVVGILTGGG